MRSCTSKNIDPVLLLLPEIKDCYSNPGPDLSVSSKVMCVV